MDWKEKVVAPVAVVAIHQLGAYMDSVRTTPPTSVWKEVATYTTYGPAVLTLGAELFMPAKTPGFVKLMTAPAVTIAADKLAEKLVSYIRGAGSAGARGAQSEAVREAQRILAQARAIGRDVRIDAGGKHAAQPITRKNKLLV